MNSYCFPYVRVSGDRQIDSGLSTEDQMREVRRLYQQQIEPRGILWADDYLEDDTDLAAEGISASKVRFCQRPVGGEINRRMRSGDHIIITKVDRIFRDWEDAVVTCSAWRRRGIIMHIMEMGMSTEHDTQWMIFQAVFGFLAAKAEGEAKAIGDRVKAAHRTLRALGCSTARIPPLSFTFVRRMVRGASRLVIIPDDDWRRAVNRAIELHEQYVFSEVVATMRAEGWRIPFTSIKPKTKHDVQRIKPPLEPNHLRSLFCNVSFRKRAELFPEHIDSRGFYKLGVPWAATGMESIRAQQKALASGGGSSATG